ncbi:MAG: tetratricopeptide repeat protein [Desulfuromonadaceae bacterium]
MSVGLLAYCNSFHAPFVFDDMNSIVENPLIKELTFYMHPSAAKKFPLYPAFKSRFVSYLSFALNYRLHGLDVAGYHIFNLAVHIGNALLLYFLVRLTFRTPYFVNRQQSETRRYGSMIALFSAFLFVSHPIQTQAVTYIVQRLASLATFFYLLSLLLYIKSRLAQVNTERFFPVSGVAFYLLALLSAIVAMKTKETAFTLPVIMVLYEFMFFEEKTARRLLWLAPLLLTMCIIPFTLINIDKPLENLIGDVGEATRLQTGISRWDYLFTQFRVIVTYLRLLLLPINQNLDYDYPIYHSLFDGEVMASLLLILSLLALAVYLFLQSRHNIPKAKLRHPALRLTAFGILWFFITLSIESGFIPIIDVIFEHRVYLPSVGFFIAVTSVIGQVGAWWGNRMAYAGKALVYVMLAAVIILSAATYARNGVWQEEISLWEDASKKSPGKIRPLNNLGNIYFDRGSLGQAMVLYQRALRIEPYHTTWYNISNVYRNTGLIDMAIDALNHAISLNPWNSTYYVNLGNTQNLIGKNKEAIESYKSALSVNPNDAKANYNLANTLEETGNLKAAALYYGEALKIQPDYRLAVEAHRRVLYTLKNDWKKG